MNTVTLGIVLAAAVILAITFGTVTGLAVKERGQLPECAPIEIHRTTQ